MHPPDSRKLRIVASLIAHALWVEAQCMVVEGPSPGTAPVNPKFKPLMFIAAPRRRRDRRFVARVVGSDRCGATGRIQAS